MHRYILPLLLLALPACSPARAVVFESPAPEGALDCALRTAVQMGFNPLDGGRDAGFIRLARPTEYTAGEAAQELTARMMSAGMMGSNRQIVEHVTLTGADGILRVQVIGVDEAGELMDPIGASRERARQILDACH